MKLDHFRDALQQAGIKLTHQRLEIYREVADSVEHPDVETIYRNLRQRLPTISLDTVYRTLWLLVDLGLIAALGAHRERARFDGNTATHHHFICERCGLTRDFNSSEFDGLSVPHSAQQFGQVRVTQVEARGICFNCMAQATNKT